MNSEGTPTIYLTEVAHEQRETGPQSVHGRGIQGNNQRDTSRESRQYEASDNAPGNKIEVQSAQGENTEGSGAENQSAHNNVQGISERNTKRGSFERDSLQGVQAEVKAPDTAEKTQHIQS